MEHRLLSVLIPAERMTDIMAQLPADISYGSKPTDDGSAFWLLINDVFGKRGTVLRIDTTSESIKITLWECGHQTILLHQQAEASSGPIPADGAEWSYDLRNVMATLIVYCRLIKQTDRQQKFKYETVIHREIRRLEKLIRIKVTLTSEKYSCEQISKS